MLVDVFARVRRNDFIDGELALRSCPARQDGAEVVPAINELRTMGFDVVAMSLEWHPYEHCSFHEVVTGHAGKSHLHASQDAAAAARAKQFEQVLLATPDGSPMPQVLYPRHCVQSSQGAECHPKLCRAETDLVVYQGTELGIECAQEA